MFGKPIRFLLLLVAAVGIPYVWFNNDVAPSAKMKIRNWAASIKGMNWSFSSGSPSDPNKSIVRQDRLRGVSFATDDTTSVLTGGIGELERILQFNVTPGFIVNQWSRVSTVHSENGLEGMRVPLVTGTNVEDIAGSLTYYFDNQQQLRRITFDGLTGDDRPLVKLISQQFNFKPEPTLGGGLYVTRWNGRPTGVLRIDHAPIVRAQRPHERLEVILEVNKPGNSYTISARAQQAISSNRLSHR